VATEPYLAPLETTIDGLLLRCYRPGDGPALQLATISSYEHLRPWMPWATAEQTLDEAEALCRRFCAQYLLNENFVIGIWIDGELAGGSGFHLRDGGLSSGTADIGMWTRAAYAGQGLGTRALRAMLQWGFRDWHWQRLTWQCDTRNIASARVAEKGGMQREALLRSSMLDVGGQRSDRYLFALLRDEWQDEPATT
jgi:RimJ/RimL family protein N-acetyltransferase